MADLPKLQVLFRRSTEEGNEILFGWNKQSDSEINSFKLYQSSSPRGTYSLLKNSIPNRVSKTQNGQYNDKVTVLVKDTEVPITEGQNHYFKLTYVDVLSAESAIADSDVIEINPPGVNRLTQGENSGEYRQNFGWDLENQKWTKIKYGMLADIAFNSYDAKDNNPHYSAPIDITGAKKVSLYIYLAKVNAPSALAVSVELAPDLTHDFVQYTTPSSLGQFFDANVTSGTETYSSTGNAIVWLDGANIAGKYLRIKIAGSGSSAVNYFTATIITAVQY